MTSAWVVAPLLVCSALFEPLRNAFYKLGSEVGGVGGVGGLANLWNPDVCKSAAGAAGAYCFHEGALLGLTPMACVFLACWVLPFCVIASRQKPVGQVLERSQPLNGSEQPAVHGAREGFVAMWATLSLLWFSVPMAMFGTASLYQRDAWHMILGISLAAAFPLSWHLSLVAIPVPSFMAEIMGMSHKELLGYHKKIAAATVCWAVLHAGGEVTWLVSQGKMADSLNIVNNGENLIYVCGMATAAALALHVAISLVRHKIGHFRELHRLFAAVTLLAAAAHWWPFTFFLIPAIGVQATSVATKQAAVQQRLLHDATGIAGKALSCATLAATGAMVLVWELRQSYMMSRGAGMQFPFLFPPAALLASFGAAFCMSSASIRLFL